MKLVDSNFCSLADYIPQSLSEKIVTCHMKGGIMKPEETVVARQRLDKQVSVPKDTHPTIEKLLEKMFSMLSMQRLRSDG
jgi:hypothetical protein